jgi:hypothetical protein
VGRADLELTETNRLEAALLWPASMGTDSLHARDQLFRMAGLAQPVVHAQTKRANSFGDRRGTRADHDPELGLRRAKAFEPFPATAAEARQIDDQHV